MSLCVFAMLVKLLEKCAFYAFYGRRGALRASKNYHDRTRLQISFKTSLSSIQKKKKTKCKQKVCIFQIVFESLCLDCKRFVDVWFLLVYRKIKGKDFL